MKQKLLSAALGILVLIPHAALAQDARALKSERTPWSTKDPNTNGAVIGAIIGAAAGAVVGLGLASINESSDSLAGPALGMAVVGAAAGAGVGWVADNFHRQVGYTIRVNSRVSVRPAVEVEKRPGQAVAHVRAGVGASLGW